MIDERDTRDVSGSAGALDAQGGLGPARGRREVESEMENTIEEPFPLVYAITLNWNGKDDTLELLDSLRRLDYPHYRVVVVDNGSEDGSVEAIRRVFPDVIVIENGENLGYADGFNVGLEYAYQQGADYFLILNNDTMIDPSAMMALVKVAEQDGEIGFVSGKVYLYQDPDRLQTVGRHNDPMILAGNHVGGGEVDRGQYDRVQDYDFIDDVYLLVRREVYEDVGGYDPNFFLYYEETDWCARVRRAGYRIVFAPGAKIWHKGNISGASTTRSPERHYFMTRNRVIFMARNTSTRQLVRYLLWSLGSEALEAARYVKHGYFRHPIARLRGLGSGLLWLVKNGRTDGARA
jgi:GT2 family glycosyltransferase